MTLRLRLTLLYGLCFLIAGAALLAITYGLVAHATSNQNERFVAQQRLVKGSAGFGDIGVFLSAGHNGETVVNIRGALPAGAGPPPGASFLRLRAVPPRGGSHKVTWTGQAAATLTTVSVAAGQDTSRPSQAMLRKLQKTAQTQVLDLVARANKALGTQHTQTLGALLTRSGVALGIMALLSIALGYLLAGRALRPLRTMSVRARAITEESLHERLGVGERRDELGELAATFDGMLGRLERAFESQRRFVANASHELRTPVALERALVEVALADPGADAASLKQTCRRVLAATEHQERVIEALLTLARSQAGIDSHETVDLAELAQVALAAVVEPPGIRVMAELEPAPVRGDRRLLERMVANLVDNAVHHNAAQAPWIRVRTESGTGQSTLAIANSGGVVAPERVDELFEPFRRLEGERTDGRGLGLGLSIVKAIALAHRGEVEAVAPSGGGLEVRLVFPAVPLQHAGRGPVDGEEVRLELEARA